MNTEVGWEESDPRHNFPIISCGTSLYLPALENSAAKMRYQRVVAKFITTLCQLQHCTQIYDTVTITNDINIEQTKVKKEFCPD